MKIQSISKSPARYLLSDTLPYEVPIIFNNRLLAKSLKNYKLIIKKEKLGLTVSSMNKKFEDSFLCIVKLLDEKLQSNGQSSFILKMNKPYNFFVPKNDGQIRELSVVNPLVQIAMMAFFDSYSDLILFSCSKSSFSIRRPEKKASSKYYNDNAHFLSKLSVDITGKVEDGSFENEDLVSYYVYNRYSNIYKFYDSYEYLELEKKFSHLLRLDISKCFNSIYTHSIAWATYGQEYSKTHKKNTENECFNLFDGLMMKTNFDETNGIVIGPEFSRVFAEVILQAIDLSVEQNLTSIGCEFGIDYVICRYVDDYFIFYNSDENKQKIIMQLQQSLVEYKMYLNKSKELIIEKPFITNISIAKIKLLELVSTIFPNNYQEKELQSQDGCVKTLIPVPYLHSTVIIKKYKSVLSLTGTTYSDTMNYMLAIMEKRLISFISYYSRKLKKMKKSGADSTKLMKDISSFLLGLSRVVFFLFLQNPSANTSLKTCRCFMLMFDSEAKWRREQIGDKQVLVQFSFDLKQYLFSEICKYLGANRISSVTPVEGLHLLILARNFGKRYNIPNKVLIEYLNLISKEKKSDLSYFSAMVYLFYIRNHKMYKELKDQIIEVITQKVSQRTTSFDKNERYLLLIDSLSCPYISDVKKKEIYKASGSSLDYEQAIKSTQIIHFINWEGFNFSKELDLKRSQLVY